MYFKLKKDRQTYLVDTDAILVLIDRNSGAGSTEIVHLTPTQAILFATLLYNGGIAETTELLLKLEQENNSQNQENLRKHIEGICQRVNSPKLIRKQGDAFSIDCKIESVQVGPETIDVNSSEIDRTTIHESTIAILPANILFQKDAEPFFELREVVAVKSDGEFIVLGYSARKDLCADLDLLWKPHLASWAGFGNPYEIRSLPGEAGYEVCFVDGEQFKLVIGYTTVVVKLLFSSTLGIIESRTVWTFKSKNSTYWKYDDSSYIQKVSESEDKQIHLAKLPAKLLKLFLINAESQIDELTIAKYLWPDKAPPLEALRPRIRNYIHLLRKELESDLIVKGNSAHYYRLNAAVTCTIGNKSIHFDEPENHHSVLCVLFPSEFTSKIHAANQFTDLKLHLIIAMKRNGELLPLGIVPDCEFSTISLLLGKVFKMYRVFPEWSGISLDDLRSYACYRLNDTWHICKDNSLKLLLSPVPVSMRWIAPRVFVQGSIQAELARALSPDPESIKLYSREDVPASH